MFLTTQQGTKWENARLTGFAGIAEEGFFYIGLHEAPHILTPKAMLRAKAREASEKFFDVVLHKVEIRQWRVHPSLNDSHGRIMQGQYFFIFWALFLLRFFFFIVAGILLKKAQALSLRSEAATIATCPGWDVRTCAGSNKRLLGRATLVSVDAAFSSELTITVGLGSKDEGQGARGTKALPAKSVELSFATTGLSLADTASKFCWRGATPDQRAVNLSFIDQFVQLVNLFRTEIGVGAAEAVGAWASGNGRFHGRGCGKLYRNVGWWNLPGG